MDWWCPAKLPITQLSCCVCEVGWSWNGVPCLHCCCRDTPMMMGHDHLVRQTAAHNMGWLAFLQGRGKGGGGAGRGLPVGSAVTPGSMQSAVPV